MLGVGGPGVGFHGPGRVRKVSMQRVDLVRVLEPEEGKEAVHVGK